MPTYVYKFIDSGETIEVQQSFADDTLTEAVHPGSGETKAVKKVFQPVGVTFKGDGFYKTDNRSKKTSTGTAGSSGDSGTSDSSSKSTESTKTDSPKASEASKTSKTSGSSSSSSD